MFDANAHPTVDGKWIDGRSICGFRETEMKLRASGFIGACAVALPGVGGYTPEGFAEAARGNFWIPVAAWETSRFDKAQTAATMRNLRTLGYRGVKIHPRLLKRMPKCEELADLIAAAHAADLRIMICSYPFGTPDTNLRGNMLEVLSAALKQTPAARIMLLHAGCIDLLRYVEFARVNPGILLDLSFTIVKYEGSSLDADLRFAFRTFDRRICLGSDFPEIDLVHLVHRFEALVGETQIGNDKRSNISWTNARRFFGVDG